VLNKYPGNLKLDGTRFEPKKEEINMMRKGLKSKLQTMVHKIKPASNIDVVKSEHDDST